VKEELKRLPNVKPRVLISALLQITIETDDTTDKLKAPIVPNWNFWPSLIFALLIYLSLLQSRSTMISFVHNVNVNAKLKAARAEAKWRK